MLIALFAVAGYLAGSIPFGLWLVRLTKGVDIRTVGSGNIGASNVWRTYGMRYGLPVMLLDITKGFAPALAATLVDGHLAGVLAGAAAMAGHARPVYLGFAKGGKMVATTGGAFLGAAAPVGLIGAAGWILVFLATRYASVASVVAAGSLPAIAYGLGYGWPVIGFGAAAGIGVLVLHRANLRRLVAGTESRFQLRGRRSPGGGSGGGTTVRAGPSSARMR
ncbi:MAG TPA: glycerol-3-phosphate 1-O-acyltransferase PlsY [Gaiellaceae bacterium]|nr:glycerol-3-phosphate 1-O-acyltransferase PlsY [Gaiellaceae bacterium]